MKKAKTLGLIVSGILTISCFFSFMPEENQSKILTVRVYEASNSYFESKILVVPEEGNPEQHYLGSFNSKNYANNTSSVNDILNKVIKRGYDLHSTSSCGNMEVFIHTYTFMKK